MTHQEPKPDLTGKEMSDLMDAILADTETTTKMTGPSASQFMQDFVDAKSNGVKQIIMTIVLASATRYNLDPGVTAAMGLVLGLQFGREIEARRRDSADLAKSVSNGAIRWC